MDLSIFERVFALRDEVRKAEFSADAPDLSTLRRSAERGETADPPTLPQEELAADLMARASALHAQAAQSDEKTTGNSRSAIAALLQAASAPLPAFNADDLSTDGGAPPQKPRTKAVALAEPRPAKLTGRSGATKTEAKPQTRQSSKKRVPRKKHPGGGKKK